MVIYGINNLLLGWINLNNMNNRHFFIILFFGIWSCQPKASYLDQQTPGMSPELFAPTIVNTDSIELNGVFNHAQTEFFFTRITNGRFVIHHAELAGGRWTKPEPIPMFPNQKVISTAVDMTVTRDGKTMYFLGQYPENEEGHTSLDIYQSKKVNGKWQLATRVDEPVSTDEYAEIYPVVVADGSLYFGSDRPGGVGKRDIYRAQYLGDGKFDTPVSLGPIVNSREGSGDAFVAADESYMVYNTRRPEPALYVSFKENGEWQTPVHLGAAVNSEATDFCPYMTPDNQYFFFSRRYSDPPASGWNGVTKGEVYWVDANLIFNKKGQ